jgi:hypothetical protein
MNLPDEQKNANRESGPGITVVRMLCDGPMESQWDEYVHGNQAGTFYHLAGWRKIIGDFLGHDAYYLYVENEGEIVGILPLAHVASRIFSNALISLPLVV